MNANDIRLVLPPSPRTVLHWFDFICPFCYLGQQRNQILSRHGLEIVHLPFQIHPDIPPEGVEAGPLADGSAQAFLGETESAGARFGVQAAPTWLIAGEMVSGLRPESEFETLARKAMRQAG